MKFLKKFAASVLACTLLMGSVSMIASAYDITRKRDPLGNLSITKSLVGNITFEESPSSIAVAVTNSSRSERYCEAIVRVYRKDTGSYIGTSGRRSILRPGSTLRTSTVQNSTLIRATGYGAIYTGSQNWSAIDFAENYTFKDPRDFH